MFENVEIPVEVSNETWDVEYKVPSAWHFDNDNNSIVEVQVKF